MSAHNRPLDEIPYSVRVSARARHVRLTVSARDGLVVVVPRGVRVDAAALVDSKRAWAMRALSRVAEKRELYAAGPEALLPATVELPATGERLPVRYEVTGARSTRACRHGHEIVVSGAPDAEARLAALKRWLDRTAREALPCRLSELATECGLHFSAVRITRARSRWGSCSAQGVIALNRGLLFLPAELCDAVMLHELAHTRVMDHSPRFWSVLSAFDPDARAHRTRLKDAALLVPAWVDA